VLPAEQIARAIRLIRGQRVLLDADLARVYGVSTIALNLAVRRNPERFPVDFIFQQSVEEADNMRSQTVTASSHGGRRTRPVAFTEQGVAMLSSVLRSRRAVDVNVQIMRAFVELRRVLEATAGLARKLNALELKYDGQFKVVFDAIRQLMAPQTRRRTIGFKKE
jgi:hypothetical protein